MAFQSPNHGERAVKADMVLIHYTGMQSAQDALERLCDPTAGVSAHYLVDEQGVVYQLVDPVRRAWHAGVSSWEGESDVNSRAVGIELVNPGHEFGYQAFPKAQIEALIVLLGKIVNTCRIPKYAMWGHSDVAPARKEDPGEKFPWAFLAQHGYGIWPSQFSVAKGTQDAAALLYQIGYDVHDLPAAQKAFKRHFRPEHVCEGWTQADAVSAAGVLAALERVRLGRRA
ncbi:MAG: N-acetylmuramoyl-L-alanine amidase [Pseudomonadota bacterium]